jgi:hypothetical protein
LSYTAPPRACGDRAGQPCPHDSRGSVDYVLRTVQQGLVHFSVMADAEANILITVCALLFSVGLTQFHRDELGGPVLLLLMLQRFF